MDIWFGSFAALLMPDFRNTVLFLEKEMFIIQHALLVAVRLLQRLRLLLLPFNCVCAVAFLLHCSAALHHLFGRCPHCLQLLTLPADALRCFLRGGRGHQQQHQLHVSATQGLRQLRAHVPSRCEPDLHRQHCPGKIRFFGAVVTRGARRLPVYTGMCQRRYSDRD